MNMVLGVLLIWLGSAMVFIAIHGGDITRPWDLYQGLISRMRGQSG